MTKRNQISKKRRAAIVALLSRILSTTGSFGTQMPDELENDMSVLDADDVIERLIHTTWTIDDPTGEETTLSFTEMIVMLFNLESLLRQKQRADADARTNGAPMPLPLFEVSYKVDEILQPRIVRRLLTGFCVSSPEEIFSKSQEPVVEITGIALIKEKLSPERITELTTVLAAESDLADDHIRFIAGIVQAIVDADGEVKVYAPKEVVGDPTALWGDDVVQRLTGTKWWLTFGDGREEILSFTSLIVLAHNLSVFWAELAEAKKSFEKSGVDEAKVTIKAEFVIADLMQPDVVRRLLGTLKIEGV